MHWFGRCAQGLMARTGMHLQFLTFSLNALVRKMRSRPNGKNWRCIPNQGLMGSAPLTMLEYAESAAPLIARTRYAKRSPFLRLESLYSVAVAGSFAIRLQVPFAP